MSMNRHLHTCAGALVLVLALSQAANAGPPLICHPFVTGSAPLLPWGEGRGWHTPDPGYDRARLTEDVLQLLSADAPVLARMENLRRATIYASDDIELATELLAAVLDRVSAAEGAEPPALAWFDAGYLIEAYRQNAVVTEHRMLGAQRRDPTGSLVGNLDGYAYVVKAISLAAESRAEMEFAASLMVREADGASAHRARAAAGAASGSLLATNLAR